MAVRASLFAPEAEMALDVRAGEEDRREGEIAKRQMAARARMK
jgi:hypothetical protein